MTGQMGYLLAQERISDLRRAADQQRLARAADSLHSPGDDRSSLARLAESSWSRRLQRHNKPKVPNACSVR